MFYIKRRVVDIEMCNIITKPEIKKLSNNKVVCYFKALINIYDFRDFNKLYENFSFMLAEITTAPYTITFWRKIYSITSKEEGQLIQLDFMRVYGYPYKPSKDKIGFYIVDALEKKKGKHTFKATDKNKVASMILNDAFSYYEGEEYLKSKYPYLNDENNKIKPLLYKRTTRGSMFMLKSLDQEISFISSLNLSPLINPNNKPELEGKSIYYKLLDTLADDISSNEGISKKRAINILLSRRHYESLIGV